VQAALRVIAAQGVAAATTRAIAAEAGMSLASVHYAFASRDELIAYAVREQVRAAISGTAEIEPDGDLVGTIRAGLNAYLDHIAADPGTEQAMFELVFYALRTPGLEDSARQQYATNYAAAAEVLEAVAEQAGCTWTLPQQDMARIVITFTDGISLGWQATRDTAATRRVIDFAADALARLAVLP
jgi:AcrR family transcriptional regulator